MQFFTEYGFAESVLGQAKARFAGAPTSRDPPDVLIFVAGPRRALLAIEAKMHDRPTTAELNEQLAAQAMLVGYLEKRLGVGAADVAHVALLLARLVAPDALARARLADKPLSQCGGLA